MSHPRASQHNTIAHPQETNKWKVHTIHGILEHVNFLKYWAFVWGIYYVPSSIQFHVFVVGNTRWSPSLVIHIDLRGLYKWPKINKVGNWCYFTLSYKLYVELQPYLQLLGAHPVLNSWQFFSWRKALSQSSPNSGLRVRVLTNRHRFLGRGRNPWMTGPSWKRCIWYVFWVQIPPNPRCLETLRGRKLKRFMCRNIPYEPKWGPLFLIEVWAKNLGIQ